MTIRPSRGVEHPARPGAGERASPCLVVISTVDGAQLATTFGHGVVHRRRSRPHEQRRRRSPRAAPARPRRRAAPSATPACVPASTSRRTIDCVASCGAISVSPGRRPVRHARGRHPRDRRRRPAAVTEITTSPIRISSPPCERRRPSTLHAVDVGPVGRPEVAQRARAAGSAASAPRAGARRARRGRRGPSRAGGRGRTGRPRAARPPSRRPAPPDVQPHVASYRQVQPATAPEPSSRRSLTCSCRGENGVASASSAPDRRELAAARLAARAEQDDLRVAGDGVGAQLAGRRAAAALAATRTTSGRRSRASASASSTPSASMTSQRLAIATRAAARAAASSPAEQHDRPAAVRRRRCRSACTSTSRRRAPGWRRARVRRHRVGVAARRHARRGADGRTARGGDDSRQRPELRRPRRARPGSAPRRSRSAGRATCPSPSRSRASRPGGRPLRRSESLGGSSCRCA